MERKFEFGQMVTIKRNGRCGEVMGSIGSGDFELVEVKLNVSGKRKEYRASELKMMEP